MIRGAGTPLLGGVAGRAGAAQPGEQKAVGRAQSSCQCSKVVHEKGGDRVFAEPVAIGQGGMVLN